jgi:hypothetical protein
MNEMHEEDQAELKRIHEGNIEETYDALVKAIADYRPDLEPGWALGMLKGAMPLVDDMLQAFGPCDHTPEVASCVCDLKEIKHKMTMTLEADASR